MNKAKQTYQIHAIHNLIADHFGNADIMRLCIENADFNALLEIIPQVKETLNEIEELANDLSHS